MASTTPQVPAWKAAFLKTCLDASILRFGSYVLKSGRTSPYFFNVGDFHTARLMDSLCTAYAEAIAAATTGSDNSEKLEFDVLFGPAYKGCGLSYGVAMRLGQLYPDRFGGVGFCHDRKEKKDHGEGGSLVGMPLKGRRVLIVDDVITAGTAKRDAIELIKREGGTVAGIVIALDRMEKLPLGAGGSDEDRNGARGSAIGQLKRENGMPVISVITLDDLVRGMRQMGLGEQAAACEEYRAIYGASD